MDDNTPEAPSVVINQASETTQQALSAIADQTQEIAQKIAETPQTAIDAVTLDTLNQRLSEVSDNLSSAIQSVAQTHQSNMDAINKRLEEWTTKITPPQSVIPNLTPENSQMMNQQLNEQTGETVSETRLNHAPDEAPVKKKTVFQKITRFQKIR